MTKSKYENYLQNTVNLKKKYFWEVPIYHNFIVILSCIQI